MDSGTSPAQAAPHTGFEGSCGAASASLDPVMDLRYNAKQIAKQSILLEDHLNSPKKRCPDCISKHFLALAALAEEAVSLNGSDEDKMLMQDLAVTYDLLFESWLSGAPPMEIAAELRSKRKAVLNVKRWFSSGEQ